MVMPACLLRPSAEIRPYLNQKGRLNASISASAGALEIEIQTLEAIRAAQSLIWRAITKSDRCFPTRS